VQSIVLLTVNYNAADWVAQLWESARSHDAATTLLIVNNSPEDTAVHKLAAPRVVILEAGENLGFGAACNLGLRWIDEQSRGAIVWLINPDAQLTPGAIQAAQEVFIAHPQAAIVGTIVQEPNGQLWFGGGRFHASTGAIVATDLFATSEADYLPCDWVTGCSLLLNLAQFAACPQFDPAYFLYYEDFDFCRRYAQMGHTIAITRTIQVIHAPSSIADRDPAFKFQCSTASYLLTLERYTSGLTLLLRLVRLGLHSLILLPFRPQTAIGKWRGIAQYLRRKRRE